MRNPQPHGGIATKQHGSDTNKSNGLSFQSTTSTSTSFSVGGGNSVAKSKLKKKRQQIQVRNRVIAAKRMSAEQSSSSASTGNTSIRSNKNMNNTNSNKKPVFGPSPPPSSPIIAATSSFSPMLVNHDKSTKKGKNTNSKSTISDGNNHKGSATSVKTSIGNIDLVTLASAVFPQDGPGKSSSGPSSSSSSSSPNGTNSNSGKMPRNARDILYAAAAAASGAFPKGMVNGVVHCSTTSSSTTTTSSPSSSSNHPKSRGEKRNNESRSSRKEADKGKSSSMNKSRSSGNSGNGSTTGPPCSDEDMKAFMNMFADFVGVPPDGPECNISSRSKQSKSSSPSNKGAAAAAAFARENFARMNIANIAAAMAGNSPMNGGGGGPNVTEIFTSSMGPDGAFTHDGNDPFPAFSMMVGTHQSSGSGGGSKSGNGMSSMKHKNGTTTSISGTIPPPPGGWPPGVAAAAAAAMAAAAGPDHEGFFGPASMGEWLQGYYDDIDDDEDENDDDIPDIAAYDGDDCDEADEGDDSIPDLITDKNRIDHSRPPQDRGYRLSNDSLKGNQANSNGSKVKSKKRSTDSKDMDDMMNKYLQKNHASNLAAAELLREEEEKEAETKDDEEEKARRAAKKREKKNRKKEKAKREAAIKSAQAAQRRREKTITSWKSRVVNACSAGEVNKLDTLLSENPFRDGKQQTFDEDILAELETKQLTLHEERTENMEWLLSSCMIKSRYDEEGLGSHPNVVDNRREARKKLGSFIMRTAFHVVFSIGDDGQSSLHSSAFAGDIEFVRLVVQRKRYLIENEGPNEGVSEEINYGNCLNTLSEDLGFSALHFAAIAGWTDVVETLLEGGCNVHTASDSCLTCRLSNGKGVTARQLVEMIRSDNWKTALDCENDDILEDILESKLSGDIDDRETYLERLEKLVDRLHDVEKDGFKSDRGNRVLPEVQKEPSLPPSMTPIEEVNSKSKKKKKKKKLHPGAESKAKVVTKASHIEENKADDKQEDPMVTALIAMGFSEDRIKAALEACGGTSRATADDLVVWMLESTSNEKTSGSGNKEKASGKIVTNKNSVATRKVEHKQQKSISQAKKKAEEAAKREAEAKAAAERLAIKREEQRRIRREWNNREQQRQKEEAKAKIAEESRRAEIEKAKALAQRRISAMQQSSSTSTPSILHPSDRSNVGSTAMFSQALQGSDKSLYLSSEKLSNNIVSNNTSEPFSSSYSPGEHISSSQISDVYQRKPTHGLLDMNANHITDAFVATGYKDSEEAGSAEGEVDAFDFPVLGKDTTKTPLSSSTMLGDSKLNQEKRPDPTVRKDKAPSTSTSLSPIPQASDPKASFDTLPLGQIRATAREFVPSSFAAASKTITGDEVEGNTKRLPQGLDTVSPTLQPGLSDTTAVLLNPVSSVPPTSASTNLVQKIPFDRPTSTSPSVYSTSNEVTDVPVFNCPPGARTSLLSSNMDNGEETANIGNAISFDNSEVLPSFLESKPVDVTSSEIPLSSTSMNTSLGLGSIANGITAPSSLATDNIWGSSVAPGTISGFNGLSNLDFGSNQKKESTSDTWGSSMPSTNGGSIW